MIESLACRWATLGVLSLLLAAGAEPPTGYVVPGRNPDSLAPWEVFVGNAAHRLIAYMYQVNHPTDLLRRRLAVLSPDDFERVSGACPGYLLELANFWERDLGRQ